METRPAKTHYLAGVIHTDTLDGKKVLTTWTTHRTEANKETENMRALGADLVRVFIDGRSGFRIVGYFAPDDLEVIEARSTARGLLDARSTAGALQFAAEQAGLKVTVNRGFWLKVIAEIRKMQPA